MGDGPSRQLVMSPYLRVEDAMKRRKMVVEWLYKRRDLFIQSSQLFWWCVCLTSVFCVNKAAHLSHSYPCPKRSRISSVRIFVM